MKMKNKNVGPVYEEGNSKPARRSRREFVRNLGGYDILSRKDLANFVNSCYSFQSFRDANKRKRGAVLREGYKFSFLVMRPNKEPVWITSNA